jgi:phage shock protein PspC (stress-responsive transcriptional regulator)
LNTVLNIQYNKQEVEVQVADKLEQKITASKTIILYPDVVDVLYYLDLLPTDYQETVAKLDSKRLYRQMNDKMIGGVCTGVGKYLGIDPVVVRVAFVISLFMFGMGLCLYILLWIIVPAKGKQLGV